jgi:hypothetical protein
VYGFGGARLFGDPAGSVRGSAVGIAADPRGQGYWVVTSTGGVYSYGSAQFHGALAAADLNAPVAGMTVDPSTGGYWLFSQDGGTFAFGAPYRGVG